MQKKSIFPHFIFIKKSKQTHYMANRPLTWLVDQIQKRLIVFPRLQDLVMYLTKNETIPVLN